MSNSGKGIGFKVRVRHQELDGVFSKKEILKKINGGKFSGDEEVALPPYDRWQKLASHPDFYDAFLKRIFSDEYHSPDAPKESAKEGTRRQARIDAVDRATRQQATRQQEPAPPEPEPGKDEGKTRRIGGDPKEVGNPTMQQQMIDELFSDMPKTQVAGAPAQEGVFDATEAAPAQGTSVLQLETQARTEALATNEPTIALSEMGVGTVAEGPESIAPMEAPPESVEHIQKRGARRGRLMLIASVGLVLILLAYFGGGDPKKPMLKEKPDIKSSFREVLTNPTMKEQKIRSLTREAEVLASNDSPIFYQGAYDVLREAYAYDESNADVLARYSEVGARLLTDNPNGENLRKEIEQNVRRGRLADPHLSQFYRVESIVDLQLARFAEARKSIENAIMSDPTSAENAMILGEVQYAFGDLPGARSALEEAVKFAPGLVRARHFLARIYFDSSDFARARAESLETLKVNPLHPPSYVVLADVAVQQNQAKEAKGLYETAGRLAAFTTKDVASQAYYRLGQVNEALGDQAGALQSFRLAYHYSTKQDAGLEAKARVTETTKEDLARLAAETEFGPGYFTEQAEGLMEQGKLNEAVRFFQAAYLLSPKDGMTAIRLGEVTEKIAVSYEDFRQVMNLYERAIERDPGQAKGYVKLGLLETEQYNWDRALRLLKQAQALAPDTYEPYVALGKYFFKRQDYNEALNQFIKAKEYNPQDSEILYYGGLIRLVIKRDAVRDAMPFFQNAYSLNPQNYDALVEWLKLKVMSYEKNFAIKFVQNLIAAEPSNPNLYWALGEVYATNNEPRRAVMQYHKALDLDNKNSKVRMSLAAALQAIGERDKAVAEYRLASLLDRRNSDGFYKAADLYFEMKNYAQSEEVLKFLITVTPNYPGAHRYLSKIHAVRRQKDNAIAEMQKEVQTNPENYKFVIELAELFMEYEKYDDAIQELKKVTNLPPLAKAPEFHLDKIRGFLLLARCYRAQSKPESAEAAIKLAIELDPNDPELHREMGYVYYDQQRDKEGVKAFEYYLSRNPAARDSETIKGLIKKMMIEE